MKIVLGIFLILHGLVHLLYSGQSFRFFELRKGMMWPDQSWLFAKMFSEKSNRWLAGGLGFIIMLGFMVSAIGLFLNNPWWKPVVLVTSILSSLNFILFCDGRLKNIDDQGVYALLINSILITISFVMD